MCIRDSIRPDLYYAAATACILCQPDGSASHALAADALADLGYRVVVLRADAPLAAQLNQSADLFGTLEGNAQ